MYDTDKNCLDKKMEDAEKKTPDVSKLVTNKALNPKIGEFEDKIVG